MVHEEISNSRRNYENKLLVRYYCSWHLCTGKCLQFPWVFLIIMYCSLKMATRVHWACILVINCNVVLIIYCYLYFCIHATDYAVHLHCPESNRGDMKGEFTWSSGALWRYVWTSADPSCVLAQPRHAQNSKFSSQSYKEATSSS